MSILLFRDGRLGQMLADRMASAEKAAREWSSPLLINTHPTILVERLVTDFSSTCPEINRAAIATESRQKYTKEFQPIPIMNGYHPTGFGRSMVQKNYTRTTFLIPVSGGSEILTLRPRGRKLQLPSPACRISGEKIEIKIEEALVRRPLEPATSTHDLLDQELDRIEQCLRAARSEIDTHNARIRHLAAEWVTEEQRKMLLDPGLSLRTNPHHGSQPEAAIASPIGVSQQRSDESNKSGNVEEPAHIGSARITCRDTETSPRAAHKRADPARNTPRFAATSRQDMVPSHPKTEPAVRAGIEPADKYPAAVRNQCLTGAEISFLADNYGSQEEIKVLLRRAGIGIADLPLLTPSITPASFWRLVNEKLAAGIRHNGRRDLLRVVAQDYTANDLFLEFVSGVDDGSAEM